jgi:pyruvate dehydrogenase E2 component (dihydrolipoamide acetyltransferase)
MYDFKFTDIGEGLHEGQILKWFFKVGDRVKDGDVLCVVETDKVNAELPSPVNGIIVKLGAEVGQTIHVGETVVIIDDSTDGSAAAKPEVKVEAVKPEVKVEAAKPEVKKEAAEEKGAAVVGEVVVSNDVIASSDEGFENSQAAETTSTKVLATPVARKMAADLRVDLTKVKGTGESGRVMKADIQKAASSNPTVSATPAVSTSASFVAPSMPALPKEGVRRVKITKLRQAIVKAMNTANLVIPATTLMDEIDVSKLVEFRKSQKDKLAEKGIKLTFLPFIVKAVTMAIKEYPIFNASFDHEAEEIVFKDFINIGIAVDTPDGLIVPNVKNADSKSIVTLAQEIEALGAATRNRTVKMEDLQNGTFSITNYGTTGIKLGTPVIKHPELAILGIGSIYKKPVVENDQIVIREVLPLSLSIDHRVIDGADGGRFLSKVKELLADPMQIFLFLS